MRESGAPTRAAIYLRISLDAAGDGLAIDRQRQDCERIAAARGWEVVETYSDSMSAYNRRKVRPAYDRMVADFHAGRFAAIVCWDLDRLTRQPRQLEDWIDAAEERGLQLVTANGEADLGTDAGRMFARIKAAVSRQEMERKSARQIRAGQQRAERGAVPSGVRPWGYDFDGSVIPDEAVIVGRIFDAFSRGESLRGICRALDDDGVPSRSGGKWSPSTVTGILRNARYAGLRTYRGEVTDIRGDWEPIVPVDVFEVVQRRLSDPRRVTNRQGTHRKHLGAGLYRCADCDVPMTTWSGARYMCPECKHSRSRPPIDDAVVTAVHERLRDPRVITGLAAGDDGERDEWRERLEQARARLARIAADYDAGLIDGTRYRAATSRARADLDAAHTELAARMDSTALAAVVTDADPEAAFDAASLMVQRAVLDSLVTVHLHRGIQGRKGWDPESVTITPKSGTTGNGKASA